MPNRILYERICVSPTLAMLTAEEERFFYRLLVQCDDYGRFDARPAVLRARCFPLQLETITEEMIAAWLNGLSGAGLIRTYTVDGRDILLVQTWSVYQRMRAKDSKYPDPPSDAVNGAQPRADVRECPASADIRGSRDVARATDPDPDAYSDSDAKTETKTKSPPKPPPQAGGGETGAVAPTKGQASRRRPGRAERAPPGGRPAIPTDSLAYLNGQYGAIVAERMKTKLQE